MKIENKERSANRRGSNALVAVVDFYAAALGAEGKMAADAERMLEGVIDRVSEAADRKPEEDARARAVMAVILAARAYERDYSARKRGRTPAAPVHDALVEAVRRLDALESGGPPKAG